MFSAKDDPESGGNETTLLLGNTNRDSSYQAASTSNGHTHHDHSHSHAAAHTHTSADLHELLHHLHDFDKTHKRRLRLLVYMGLILVYFALVSSLLCANNLPQSIIEERYFLPFHYTEFWSAFVFTLLEAFILIGDSALAFDTAQDLYMLYLLGFNVVTSLIAAMLFTLHPETYEVPSHLIEYACQICVTMVDFIFIFQKGATVHGNFQNNAALSSKTGCSNMTASPQRQRNSRFSLRAQVGFATLLLLMDVFKFLFYLEIIPSKIGYERSSHYFEFVGEMLNSAWAFSYAKDLYVELSRLEFHDLHTQLP